MKFINIFKRKKNKQQTIKQQEIDLIAAGYYTNDPPNPMGIVYDHLPEITKTDSQTTGIVLPPAHIYKEEPDHTPARKNNSIFSNTNTTSHKPNDFISPIPPYSNGKEICKMTRNIRQEYAKKLGIEMTFEECTHEGPCSGTCPKCEQELEIINNAISKRKNEEQL